MARVVQRIGIVTPSLGTYRRALFEELASSVELTLFYPSTRDVVRGALHEPCSGNALAVPGGIEVRLWPSPRRLAAFEGVLIYPWDVSYAGLAPTLAWRYWKGKPTMLWGHGPRPWTPPARMRLMRSLRALSEGELIYSLRSTHPALLGGCEIGNSLDLSSVEADPAPWSWPFDTQVRLLFASRLQPRRRLHHLFAAMRELLARDITVSLVTVGSGALRDLGFEPSGLQVAELGPTYDPSLLAAVHRQATGSFYPAAAGLAPVMSLAHGLPSVVIRGERHGPEVDLLAATQVTSFRQVHASEAASALLELSTERVAPSAQASIAEYFSASAHAKRLLDAVDQSC